MDRLRAKNGAKLRRSLTVPLQKGKRQKTNDQLKCNLFKLPYEIRRTIYQIVIDAWGWGDIVHIDRPYELRVWRPFWNHQSFDLDDDGLTYIPCRTQPDNGHPATMGLDVDTSWPDNHMQCLDIDVQRVKSDLNMLLSCRRLYSEAINMLYSNSAFVIHLPWAYPFLSVTPMSRLIQITRLHIIWPVHIATYQVGGPIAEDSTHSLVKCQRGEAQWLNICKILRSMTGLKELRIRIFKATLDNLHESILLESLTGIRLQEGKFTIELPAINERLPTEKSKPRFPIDEHAAFTIQRRTLEGDRTDLLIAPSYDPDPISWQRLVSIIILSPIRKSKIFSSHLVEKLEKKIRGL